MWIWREDDENEAAQNMQHRCPVLHLVPLAVASIPDEGDCNVSSICCNHFSSSTSRLLDILTLSHKSLAIASHSQRVGSSGIIPV